MSITHCSHGLGFGEWCSQCFVDAFREDDRLPAPADRLHPEGPRRASADLPSPAGALGLGVVSPRRGPRDDHNLLTDQAPHTEGMGPFGLSGCGGKHQCPLAAHPTESEQLSGPRALCIALAAGGLFWALVVIAVTKKARGAR